MQEQLEIILVLMLLLSKKENSITCLTLYKLILKVDFVHQLTFRSPTAQQLTLCNSI